MGKKNTKKTLKKRVKSLEKMIADMATNQRTLTDMVITEKFGKKKDVDFDETKETLVPFGHTMVEVPGNLLASDPLDPEELDFGNLYPNTLKVPEVRVCPVESNTVECNDAETRYYGDKINLGNIARITSPYGHIMTFSAVLIDHLGETVTRWFSFNPDGEDGMCVVFNFDVSSEYDENQLRLSYNTASSVIDTSVRRLLESVDTYKPDNINLINLAASVTSMVDDAEDFEVLRGVKEFDDINTDDEFVIYESDELPKNSYSYEYRLMKLAMTFEYDPIYDTKNINFTIKEEEENNG